MQILNLQYDPYFWRDFWSVGEDANEGGYCLDRPDMSPAGSVADTLVGSDSITTVYQSLTFID